MQGIIPQSRCDNKPALPPDAATLAHHRASCGRKEAYLTAAAAQWAKDHWDGPRRLEYLLLHVYACTACGLFHLGKRLCVLAK
jgi:hypothetical protein